MSEGPDRIRTGDLAVTNDVVPSAFAAKVVLVSVVENWDERSATRFRKDVYI